LRKGVFTQEERQQTYEKSYVGQVFFVPTFHDKPLGIFCLQLRPVFQAKRGYRFFSALSIH
jgi:hypothetical protein